MIVPAAIAGVVAVFALTNRSIAPLGDLRFRAVWLVLVALGIQIGLVEFAPSGLDARVSAALHICSYAAGLAFIWSNRRLTGLVVLGAGGALNLAVIAANDGVMPASEQAIETAGLRHDDTFQNSAPVDDPALAPLGDVFAIPEPVPLANVFSIGDVLIVVGAGVLVSSVYRRDREGMIGDPAVVVAREAATDAGGPA